MKLLLMGSNVCLCMLSLSSQLRSSGIDASAWRDEKLVAKKAAKAAAATPKTIKTSSSSGGFRAISFVFLLTLFAVLAQVFHLYISAPVKPGHVVTPGVWLSKCGLMSFFKPDCENAYFSLDKTGKATLTNAKKEVVWTLEGGVCKKSKKFCKEGMEVTPEGEVLIGGELVKYAITQNDKANLSAWPFNEIDNLKLRKKSRSNEEPASEQ